MNWYLKVLKQYVDFDGRASRQEYWMFVLFNFLISIVLGVISQKISGVYALVVMLPSIAVGIRRLHDIGKSGWFLLVSFIPIIGWIWIIVLLATEGVASDNEYGVVPNDIGPDMI